MRSHTNHLLSLAPVFGERNVSRLRQLLDQTEIHYRGLKVLGVDPKTYSNFVVPFLMEKVPELILLSMIRAADKDQLEWTIEDFIGALEKEVKVRESHMLLRHQPAPPVKRQQQQQQQQAKNGVSLNDCLHVGPSLTPLLFDMLLRFRHFKICLIGDIEKAFLNIGVTEDDRNCLRFLWISDIKADKPQLQVYRYNTAVFGVNSSPFFFVKCSLETPC